MSTAEEMWSELAPIGRAPSGGYQRFAWTRVDATLREWFAAAAVARGFEVIVDRAGNQWAWTGDPDRTPGVVLGSHLDSVPDGGAYDGPLGIVSAFAALDIARQRGFEPTIPLGVVNFADEEGARFGVACAGSRVLTGALDADRWRGLADADAVTVAEALTAEGLDAEHAGSDPDALRRIGQYVELHIEQGKQLIEDGSPLGVASVIWPHGRWRIDLPGQANHAGTTQIEDRYDAMLGYASVVLAARAAAIRHEALATCGKVQATPNAVNAIASSVTGWLDARGPSSEQVQAIVAEVAVAADSFHGLLSEESWTDETLFDAVLRDRLQALLGHVPVLATGAGHDAGILAAAGIPAAMIFVRNPTGISHSPAESADWEDCLAGINALAAVIEDLTVRPAD